MPGTNNFVNINSSLLKYSFEPLAIVSNCVNELMDSEYLFNEMPDISTGARSMTSGAGSAILYPDSHDPDAIITADCFGYREFSLVEDKSKCLMIATEEDYFFGVPAANSGFFKMKQISENLTLEIAHLKEKLNLKTSKL